MNEGVSQEVVKGSFDWVPFYEELADALVPYRTRQEELLSFLGDLRRDNLKVTPL